MSATLDLHPPSPDSFDDNDHEDDYGDDHHDAGGNGDDADDVDQQIHVECGFTLEILRLTDSIHPKSKIIGGPNYFDKVKPKKSKESSLHCPYMWKQR